MTPPIGLPLRSSTVASAGIGGPAVEGGQCSLSTSSPTLAQPQEHVPTTRAEGAWQRNSVTPEKSRARRLDSTSDSASVSGRPVRSGDIWWSIAPKDPNLRHDPLEEVVGLRAHHQVFVGDDVGRDAVDPKLLRFAASRVEVVAEPVLLDRRLHSSNIDAGAGCDPPKASHVAHRPR